MLESFKQFAIMYTYQRGNELKHSGDKTMKDFKVTVKGETGTISYDVYRTEKGALSFGKKVANEAFYGEESVITVVAL
tara:strand:+ start:1178 stop:1411 length:234 start_codon:yes stop_codon:yes gene_type:complete